MPPTTPTPEWMNLAGTGGLILALVLSVRYLAGQWQQAQAQIVALLSDALRQNTEVLHDVRSAIARCNGGDMQRWTKPQIVPIQHAPDSD